MKDILGERDDAIPDVPTRVAEPSRESGLPKRFYKHVEVQQQDGLFEVRLDNRPVKTPGKSSLAVAHEKIASFMAAEWEAQKDHIDPMTMPVTRIVNTAIDGVANDMQAIREDILRYSGTDLLCYRVSEPQGLVEQQIARWDPLTDWAQSVLGARFNLAEGVMYVEQPPEAIAAVSVHVGLIDDPLVLAATHVVMTLTGSAILALAVLKGEVDAGRAWEIAHIDEEWNADLWGRDKEADDLRAKRFVEMKAACQIIDVAG